jgi:hypothetical protein
MDDGSSLIDAADGCDATGIPQADTTFFKPSGTSGASQIACGNGVAVLPGRLNGVADEAAIDGRLQPARTAASKLYVAALFNLESSPSNR